MHEVPEVFYISNINYEDVCNDVKKLKMNNATESENIPSYIFKEMVGFLAKPFRNLFNKCFKTNNFPEK